jgi:cell division septation protein DedD
MAKNLYVKGYGTGRPKKLRLSPRRIVVLGTLAVLVLAVWTLKGQWQKRPQSKPYRPPVRHKIVGSIPPPPEPATVDDSGPATSPSILKDAAATELEMAMEATAPPSSRQAAIVEAEQLPGESPQVSTVTEAQQKKKVADSRRGIQNRDGDGEEAEATAQADVKKPKEIIVVQVGAFRSRAGAEELVEWLQGKGIPAYLNERKLRDLGLLYRVRIGGYSSVDEARVDVQRLRKQEGIECFILKLAPE